MLPIETEITGSGEQTMPTSEIDYWLEKIQADGEAVTRDRARQITVTTDFTRDNGDRLTITVTGIAPFTAFPSVGPLTGVPGWSVAGQRSLARGRTAAVLRNGPPCLRGPLWGGLPLLTESEARRLAMALNAQIAEVA